MQAVGASIQSTCSDIRPEHLGTCERFEERQIGGERFNFLEGCPKAKTCTLVLRGGAEQFIAEVERSLHDAIMIVKRAIRNNNIVAGGGACEVIYSSDGPLYHTDPLIILVISVLTEGCMQYRWPSPLIFIPMPIRTSPINNR